jgi:hypothetical protein
LKTSIALSAITLAASLTASADFSYTTTQKATGGSMAAMAGAAADRNGKYYLKGQKMASVNGDVATIMDFGAQTITTINNTQKTYTVKEFSDLAADAPTADLTADVKETGQKKNVNGFDASEVVITMNMDMEPGRGAPTMKMQVEVDMWIAADVPGASEMRDFFKKNASNFPWSAMMGSSGNPGMTKAMAQIQQQMAKMNGVPVEEIVRVKPGAGSQMAMPQMPQLTPDQQAKMQAAMAQMQAMQKQGGAQAAAAQQAMAAMAGMGRGPAAGGGSSTSLIEMTIDSSGFSSASLPDSVFAVPAGYTQK